jgi:nitrite reductase/ring-hydroxylating ferredoxin subunit
MGRFVEVAKKSEIPEGGAIGMEVEGKRLALINLGGEIYAIDDDCPHEGGPLSDGTISGEEIECPWHTSRFNIKTGRVTMDPDGKRRHVQGAPRWGCGGSRNLGSSYARRHLSLRSRSR